MRYKVFLKFEPATASKVRPNGMGPATKTFVAVTEVALIIEAETYPSAVATAVTRMRAQLEDVGVLKSVTAISLAL